MGEISVKVLLNKSHGAHFASSKEMIKLKRKLKIDIWEEFVTDQRVIAYIEEHLISETDDFKDEDYDEFENISYKVMCEVFGPIEGKVELEKVDINRPWMIQSYDDYERIKYLTELKNNQYIDESESIYEY